MLVDTLCAALISVGVPLFIGWVGFGWVGFVVRERDVENRHKVTRLAAEIADDLVRQQLGGTDAQGGLSLPPEEHGALSLPPRFLIPSRRLPEPPEAPVEEGPKRPTWSAETD